MICSKQATSHKPQATSHKPQAFKLGFTLSELLVSLAVLGLIAGLTVPSVVNAVRASKTLALLKETQQVLQSIVTAGIQEGNLAFGWQYISSNRDYIRSKLNATKICPTNPVTEGCLTTVVSNVGSNDYHVASFLTGSGYAQILPNGVTISSGGNNVANGGLLVIDMNNTEAPNRVCLNPLVDPVGSCDIYLVWINFSEDTDFAGGYSVGKKQTAIINYYQGITAL